MIECSVCKANNEDRSLYCLECGQRLIPKVPDPTTTANILPSANPGLQPLNYTNSGRLHSPILDLDEQAEDRRNQGQFGIEEFSHGANAVRPNSISRNGLHSPLLDGKNQFVNPHPFSERNDNDEKAINTPQTNRNENQSDKSRLHSPVLDGPMSGSFSAEYIEESFSTGEEYESLRSPLLKSKVPLPQKNEPFENVTGQESRLQSLLGTAFAPAAKAPVHSNIANQESPVAPLSVTGINKLTKANAIASRTKLEKISGSQSLLPTEDEISPGAGIANSQSKSALNKALLTALIFLAIGLKIWYLISLGSAAFGSAPFAFDQGGQIVGLLVILVLVLS